MHKCKPRIQHVLVWSKEGDHELIEFGRKVINTKFIKSLYAFSISDLSHILTGANEEEVETIIEQYNFYVIKIHDQHLELVMLDTTKHIIERHEDFEISIKESAKTIKKYHAENFKD